MAAVTTYETVRTNTQKVLYDIISNDTTVKSMCRHIIDGSQYKISRQRGFPYIVVNTPTTNHGNTFICNTRFRNELICRVSIVSIKESVVRELADAVAGALKNNQNETREARLNWFKILASNLRPMLDNKGDTVYHYEIDFGYTFVG